MKIFISSLFLVLLVLHQDFWWWGNDMLVFGILPIGLAFHALFSIACAGLGGLAISTIWPGEIDEAESSDLPS